MALAALVLSTSCGDEHNFSGSSTAATVVAEVAVDARTRDLQIDSPTLGATVGVRVLLPPHWSPNSERRWPVLYVLHGAEALTGEHPPNYQSWSLRTDIAALTADDDMLVVMPEGGNVGWYSDWYNDGHGGAPAWETFHLVELPEILEERYRAGNERAIAGLSMGGFGATSYAARHPGMFRAVAAFSAPLTMNEPLAQTIVTVSLTVQGFDRYAVWGDPMEHPEIWAAHDPFTLADNLVGIPVFISAGNGSPGPFDPGREDTDVLESAALESSTAFADHLRSLGGDVTTDFYGNGTHSWPYWQQELQRAMPHLLAALEVNSN